MENPKNILRVERLASGLRESIGKCIMSQKHAAFAIKNGRIVAPAAVNQYKPYTFGVFEGTRHAEISAICNLLGKEEQYVLPNYSKEREKR